MSNLQLAEGVALGYDVSGPFRPFVRQGRSTSVEQYLRDREHAQTQAPGYAL